MAEVTKVPVKTEQKGAAPATAYREFEPFATLRREIDRLFDDFRWPSRLWSGPSLRSGFDLEPFSRSETSFGLAPAVDVAEKEKQYEITAELPGIDPANVELKLANGVLTLKGEKQEEKEEKDKDYYLSERRYGSFVRSFRLPEGVDAERIDARFDKGVLTVIVPKTAEAQKKEKKIEIKAA
jgi:HSP20 family protein